MKTQHDEGFISIYDNYSLDSEIKNTEEKYYFIFYQRELLLVNNQVPPIKGLNEINIGKKDVKNCLYIGEYYSKDCFENILNLMKIMSSLICISFLTLMKKLI